MQRRTLLKAAAAGALLRCGDPTAPDRTFPQGVGSGDPTPDGVLLWTRVEGGGSVRWEVASDERFKQLAASGEATASADRDHTVRIDVTGLKAGTPYWYRFIASNGNVSSPIGRTRTAPDPDTDAPLRIALASCQDFGGRYFHAWRSLLERDDIDLVLFIGDYIYETIGHLGVELPAERSLELPDGLELNDPNKGRVTAVTLADYRALYRQYRKDPDLRAVHARFPFVTIWDDHEFANDGWQDHATDFDDARGDEKSPERRAAATRAWYEYQPIRRPDGESPYRAVRWGKNAELVVLDERFHRDDHLVPEGPIDRDVGHFAANSAFGSRTFVVKDVFDPREQAAKPTMLGAPQRDWAIAALTGSTATWKLLCSPLVMAQLLLDLRDQAQLPAMFRQRFYFKTDQWDGFRSERRALLEACANVENLAVLSGDLHGFYAAELHADPDAPAARSIAVEYAVSAVSAPAIDVQLRGVIKSDPVLESLGLLALVPTFDKNLLATNPHLRHAESRKNGLALVDVGAAELRVTFLESTDVTKTDGGVAREVAFRTPAGSRAIEKMS